MLAGLTALVVFAVVDAFFIEPNWIALTRHEVGEGQRGISLLHLSDIHFTTFGPREGRILEIIRETRPDVIVITGDCVLHETDREGLIDFLSRLEAPLGVFACPGNWEDWVKGAYDCFEPAGVTLLRDRAVTLGDTGIELSGVSLAQSRIPDSDAKHRILLCHYPAVFPAAARAGIDLVLAGHTHGGQVRFPLIGPLWLPSDSGDYDQGWFREGDSRLYVSRGVGTSILRVRFLCRPEVALHTYRY